MDRDDDIGEPESSESGGDDSSSQSSKVSGEKDEVYVVETILAERKRRGVVEYLTAWKGWGEHYHTWEIEDNFNQDTTFTDWRNKRMRITRGFEPPFDVKAWKKRHDEYWLARYAKDDEKTRRNKQVDEPNPEESRGDEEKKDEDMHESDNSVHGFDSESAIKTPVEVIKTRNVHQDLPQSSPTRHSSSPSSRSSSSFEDDDHPQLSRQSPLANTCKPKWTHEETIALMKSLQALESPQWDKFCDLYGPKGTMSDALKDKSLEDVQEKVRSTRQEFVKSGREPPLYLNIVLPDTNNVYIRRASSKGKSKSSAQSRASSQERRRSSSRDSMMEELRAAKLRKDELKNAPNAPPITNSTKKLPLPEATPTSTRMNNPPIKTQKTDEARGKLISKIVTSVPPSEVPQLEDVRRVEKSARTEPSRGHWAGTAKTIMDPPASNAARMGAIGRGPARPNPLKIKQMAKSHDTRRKAADTTMIDVAANWNAAPKARKRKTLPTTNAASATGQTHKPFGNMAIRNAVRKSRLEHVPDPNRLVFIDPKTGKTPKALSSLSATKTLVEWPVTPFQKYQEELAAKETEAQAVKKPESYEESEDTLMVDATEPTISMQPPEKEPQASVGKATRTKANSLSPSNDADDDKDNALPNLEAQSHSYSLRPPMFRPDHPSGVPTGPKISATGTNTIALRDYIDRSLTNNSPGTNSTTTGLNQSLSGEKLSGFRLLDHPSREEEAWLFKIRDENVIIGDIKIETSGQANIRVKFLGLSHEVRQLVFSIKILPRTMNFEFEKVCKAYEYHSYFPAETSDYLGSGFVVPYPETLLAFETLSETLADNLQGGLFFATHFTMLIYPAGATAWAFLNDKLPQVPPGAKLRFIVRKPLPQTITMDQELSARLANENPQQYAEIVTRIKAEPIRSGEKHINTVFRDMFEIDYGHLVAQNGPQKYPPSSIFFLCFIPQGSEMYEPETERRLTLRAIISEEHDFFVEFLQANGAAEIYSMQNIGSYDVENNGAWDYFKNNVKSGTIIFHDACIRLDQIPHLARFLQNGAINVWKTSLTPMHPGEKHPHLFRLFPHGGVLLLTESMFLYRPQETLRILMWFRRVQLPSKPAGTWKVATRPRVREWILDIMDACTDNGKDIFGCGGIQIFAAIYTEIIWLLGSNDPGNLDLMCHEWDTETPTDDAPMVSPSSLSALQARKEWKGEGSTISPDHDHVRQNDDLLTQWFAEWAIVSLHRFRKFHIILSHPDSSDNHEECAKTIKAVERRWGHVEALTAEDCFKRHRVTDQTKLDEMEAERRKRARAELSGKKQAARQARAEEREAAKDALEERMRYLRDGGAGDGEVVEAGRRLLRGLGASEKEVRECRVDEERVFEFNYLKRLDAGGVVGTC